MLLFRDSQKTKKCTISADLKVLKAEIRAVLQVDYLSLYLTWLDTTCNETF